MAITLRKLCQHAKDDYEMQLICGEKNLDNLVEWVHMLEDPETANFLHGQELIFTTGIAQTATDWFIGFVKGLKKNQAAGWVLNLGPYISKVPDEIITYCKQEEFPLFVIPWKTRIVDITNDFCHQIIKAEENEVSVASAFRHAIFNPEKKELYDTILERKAFQLEGNYAVLVFEFSVSRHDQLGTFTKIANMHLTKLLYQLTEKFGLFRQDRYLVLVTQTLTHEEIKLLIERFEQVCTYGRPAASYCVGSSGNEKGIHSLAHSYKRAMMVCHLAKKQHKRYLVYEELGLYQVLIEVENEVVLRSFYQRTLGVLEDYDEKHQSDYTFILKAYLDHNYSVEKVAKETFVHRNTINYKIKKIKEILNSDLNNEESLHLMLAYRIKEIL